jgi:hypothetical protein
MSMFLHYTLYSGRDEPYITIYYDMEKHVEAEDKLRGLLGTIKGLVSEQNSSHFLHKSWHGGKDPEDKNLRDHAHFKLELDDGVNTMSAEVVNEILNALGVPALQEEDPHQ